MAHIRMKIYSNCLRRYTHVTVVVPTPTENDFNNPDGTPNLDEYDVNPYFKTRPVYRVLYLLHGTHGDDTDWCYYTNLERTLIGTDLIVVCPDGNNSFWTDLNNGPQYEKYLTGELRTYINNMFPTRTDRASTFLAGLSMGGMATLNIGYRHPGLYSKIVCLSGGFFTEDVPALMMNRSYPWQYILNPNSTIRGTKIDGLGALKKDLEEGVEIPELYFTVGTEDDIVGVTAEKSRKVLDELGVPYVYDVGPGGHTYEFWSEHIAKAIPWLLETTEEK